MEKKLLIRDDPWSEAFKNKLMVTPHYKTVLQWKENVDIQVKDTYYYQWLKTNLDKNGVVWNGTISNEDDVIKQCNKFKEMFIIAPNWNEQKEITVASSKCDDEVWFVHDNVVSYFFGPITVRIDEFGDFIVSDGNHRLVLLLANDLPIEVTICERHPKWQQVIDKVDKLYPEVMYQPFNHPEFFGRKCSRTGITEKIVNSVVDTFNVKSVLDLGCCHGETLYSLRNKNVRGIGVESNEDRLKLVSLLFSKIKFEYSGKDIYDFLKSNDEKYDLILVLAVFHHFMYFNEKEKFIDLLELIVKKTDILMYELPEKNEPQYSWIYKDYDAHKVIQSYFKNVECFKKDSRFIYLLRK